MVERAGPAIGTRSRELRQRVAFLVAGALAVFAVACAQPGAPPGGPPDTELPVLLRVLPESNAVNVRTPAVVLAFDEVVSERSSGPAGVGSPGVNSLNSVLVLSPSDGLDEVIWRRTNLELRPRRGLRPNTTYRVTLNPGLTDLRGNRTTEAFDYVFSTGPTAANGQVEGVIFDWTTGKPAPNARVELFRDGDSTFRWMSRSDSSGRFRVRDLSAGTYEVRAWMDLNNDRRISFREISDSARVSLTDTASLELYAFVRDTVAPRIENLELVDSTALRVRFDRGIVHDWDGVGATLLAADSSEIPLGGVMIASTTYDSLAKARRATADSVAKAADTMPADSVAVDSIARDSVAADSIAADSIRTDSIAADSIASDTLPPAPVFRRVVPQTSWSVPLTAPLAPGSYRLRVRFARGLNGRAAFTDREFRVQPPPPPAPADTTKARAPTVPPADTTKPPVPSVPPADSVKPAAIAPSRERRP